MRLAFKQFHHAIFALTILPWCIALSGCQIAPSDSEKLQRLRNAGDVPIVTLRPEVDTTRAGDSIQVEYAATARHSEVKAVALEYSRDGDNLRNGDSYAHVGYLSPSGSRYSWTIPAQLAGLTLRFRIRAVNAVGNVGSAVSIPVRVSAATDSEGPASLRLTSFQGGGIYAGGIPAPVSFIPANGNLGPTPLRFSYSLDSGVTWTLIGGAVPNESPFVWTPPAVDALGVRLKVTATALDGTEVLSESTSDFELDAQAPAMPTALTRVSPVAAIGNDSTPTVRVHGLVAGDTIRLYRDPACTVVSQVAAGIALGSTIDLTTDSLGDGAYAFYARSHDPVGNPSACSVTSIAYRVDTTPPATPTSLTLLTATNPGGSPTPVHRAAGVTAGDAITLYTDVGCTISASAPATAAGATVDVTSNALSAGASTTFRSRSVDPAGNVSGCSPAGVAYTFTTPIYAFDREFFTLKDDGTAVGAAIAVRRNVGGSSATLSVAYDPVTATASDFTPGAYPVSISGAALTVAGMSAAAAVLPNVTIEGDKYFRVRLTSTDDGGTLAPIRDAQVNVIDSRLPGDFFFPRSLYSAVRADSAVTITVQRVGVLDAATVDLTFLSGTAAGGTDFTATTRTLTFGAGVSEATTNVPLSARAGSRSFFVELKNPSGAHTLRPWATAKVRIVDEAGGCDPLNTDSSVSNGFGGGNGIGTPYLICSLAQLYRVRSFSAATHYRMAADIDAEPTLDADPSIAGVQPFTAPSVIFGGGVFDGNEHVIRNFRQVVTGAAAGPIGLFSEVTGAATLLKAINLDLGYLVSTFSTNVIGGLVGKITGLTGGIQDGSFSGRVQVAADGTAGGILAHSAGRLSIPLTRMFTSGLIQIADDGNGAGAGGIIGGVINGDSTSDANLSDTYSTATVYSPLSGYIGGLFGWSNYTSDIRFNLTRVHSKGLVKTSGYGNAGGLFGTFGTRGAGAESVITDSFSHSPVIGGGHLGGIGGEYACYDGATICSIANVEHRGIVRSENVTLGAPKTGGAFGFFALDTNYSVNGLVTAGDVSTVDGTYGSGGVFGAIEINATAARTIQFENITASGTLADLSPGNSAQKLGGVVGIMHLNSGSAGSIVFDGLDSTVEVGVGRNDIGGAIGEIEVSSNWGMNTIRITDAHVLANLSGAAAIGGILGTLRLPTIAGLNFRMDHSTYSGIISGTEDGGGGAIGFIDDPNGPASVTIDHFATAGDVTFQLNSSGGIVGQILAAGAGSTYAISDTRSSMTVRGVDGMAGGITGYVRADGSSNSFSIERSGFLGSVSGGSGIGGIIGYSACQNAGAKSFRVTESFVTGAVSVDGLVGGGIWGNAASTHANCNVSIDNDYVSGPVTGERAGGIIGSMAGGTRSIDRCYSRSAISGVDAQGIQWFGPAATSTYWKREALTFNDAVPPDGNDETDAALRSSPTYVGFDFDPTTGIWVSNPGGYPTLRSNPE